MSRRSSILIVLGLFVPASSAEMLTVPIDAAQSSVTATLSIIGGMSSDTSPVAGLVVLRLETVASPTSVTGLDFDLSLTEPLDFSLGTAPNRFTSTVTGFHLLYADPGAPIGPVPATPTFVFADVPTKAQGMLTYQATGTACLALLANGLPCADTDDLSTEPTSSVDFAGTVSSSADRVVSVEASVDQTMPVDPANPALGTLRVQGTIRGNVFVPGSPGDANGDCAVNFADVTSVLQHFGGTGFMGDSDGDGDVDFGDVTGVLQNWGGGCS